jgi:hypothetical protein
VPQVLARRRLPGDAIVLITAPNISLNAGPAPIMVVVAASHAGVYSNVEPASGAFFGVLFLKEPLGPLALAGGVLVNLATVLISLSPPKPSSS